MANNKDFKVKNGIQPTVYHEGLGTVTSGSSGYSLASASYDNVSFSFDTSRYANGFVFGNNGTKLYTVYSTGDVRQYSLSTAYDISTVSYDSVSKSVTAQDTSLLGINFKPDGTKMYIVGNTNHDAYQYNLSTAWDLSTATYNATLDLSSTVVLTPIDIIFNDDGTKVYILSGYNDDIFQYSLSTAYDISTASYDSKTLSLDAEDTIPYGFQFLDNGNKIWVCGRANDTIYQYNLTTAYDISTGSYSGTSFATSQDPYKFNFNADGTKIILLGSVFGLHQYSTTLTTATLDLSTGSVFEITPTSDIQIGLSNPAASGAVSQATLLLDQAGAGSYDVENATYANKSFSVATEESGPQAMHFKSDGTQFFLVGNTDTVRSYSLSTAWDISTTSYDSKSISVNAQNSIPLSVHVKSDGTKFYMLGTGTGGDAVYSYSMSTAYDLSTASYDSVSFSVATQTTSPQAMWFKPDGTTMYIASSTVVYQYTLSTAWNISTASYASKSFTTSTQDTNMDGLTFKSDGTKVYMTGVTNDNVYQYSLSTAWDISTASYDSIALDTSSESGDPRSLQLSSDGKVLMVLGTANDTVYQYNASAPATITYDSTLQFGGGTAPDSPAIGETDVLTFSTRDGGTTYQAAIAIDGAA